MFGRFAPEPTLEASEATEAEFIAAARDFAKNLGIDPDRVILRPKGWKPSHCGECGKADGWHLDTCPKGPRGRP